MAPTKCGDTNRHEEIGFVAAERLEHLARDLADRVRRDRVL